MASKIRVLDEHTINKIAAGEVIESPASVVKELVENSIDAGSTSITIEIRGGGRQLIRISDNGCGMNRDDAILSLERHATSKIKQVEDIESIDTMGFRGEAIPSIASISKFMLLTASADDEQENGTMLIVEGGKILDCKKAPRSFGTTIEVKSLFYNVPVRRKFQKSPAHDSNEILKTVTLLSLCNPQVKFELIDNQKIEIQTHVKSDNFKELLKERVSALMGPDFINSSTYVENHNQDISLKGYVGLPHAARLNRTGQYLFINNRAVSSSFISYLIKEAFSTSIPSNRHPVFILYLNLPGDLVDVNVHPQKKEVRLRQQDDLRALITKTIKESISFDNFETTENFEIPTYLQTFNKDEDQDRDVSSNIFSFSRVEESLRNEYDKVIASLALDKPQAKIEATFLKSPLSTTVERKSAPRVIATIKGFIIIDAATLKDWKDVELDSLCLIDQKSAHARVIFEELLDKKSDQLGVQSLLIPVPIDLSIHEANLLKLHLELLNEKGIDINESGPHQFLVSSLPSIFGNIDINKFIQDLLEDLTGFKEEQFVEKKLEFLLSQMALKISVQQSKTLQQYEAETLVKKLFTCKQPFYCPKGKATLTTLSCEEIIKKFQKESA